MQHPAPNGNSHNSRLQLTRLIETVQITARLTAILINSSTVFPLILIHNNDSFRIYICEIVRLETKINRFRR